MTREEALDVAKYRYSLSSCFRTQHWALSHCERCLWNKKIGQLIRECICPFSACPKLQEAEKVLKR